MIDSSFFIQYGPQLLWACVTTLKIAFFGTLLGFTGGTLLALGQRSHMPILAQIINAYVTVVRGTPMVVQITFYYYALNLPFPPVVIFILAIGANSAAYISQIIKAGIQSVDKGQIEAAFILGLTKMQTTRYIILPQAIKVVLPALGNEFATLIKDSSLAYMIGVNELFKEGRNIMSNTYDVMSVYVAITLLYLIMTYCVTFCVDKLEKKWNEVC